MFEWPHGLFSASDGTVWVTDGKKQIVVMGDRFDPNATLIVDGTQVSARFDSGVLIAKPVPLASGTHEIRVVNPSGVASQSFSFTVN